jgi:hypothetical protein
MNVDDEEWTPWGNRRRGGSKQNGRQKRSPTTKQREKASKAFIHKFKHNDEAIKYARQRLSKLVEESAMAASSAGAPGSLVNPQLSLSSPSLLSATSIAPVLRESAEAGKVGDITDGRDMIAVNVVEGAPCVAHSTSSSPRVLNSMADLSEKKLRILAIPASVTCDDRWELSALVRIWFRVVRCVVNLLACMLTPVILF